MNTSPTTPADSPSGTPCDRILNALALNQECSRGDLLSAAELQSYSELEKFLIRLGDEGKITAHFHACGFRTYRLAEMKPKPPFWMLPKPPE